MTASTLNGIGGINKLMNIKCLYCCTQSKVLITASVITLIIRADILDEHIYTVRELNMNPDVLRGYSV